MVAHEIAHDALRHMPETFSRWPSWGIGAITVGDKADINQKIKKLEEHLEQTGEFQIASDLLFGIKRGDEVWADKYAVWNMHAAGYNPKAAVTIMERLIKQGEDLPKADSFAHLMDLLMSTHPPNRDRINLLKLELIWMRIKPSAVLDTEEFRAVRRRLLAKPPVVTAQDPARPTQPGPEHKQLGAFVGTWELELNNKLGSPGMGKGTYNCDWETGGTSVFCRCKTTTGMYLIVYGYNPQDRNYTMYWYWSTGKSDLAKGSVSGNTWTFLLDPDRVEGKTRQRKETLQVSPDFQAGQFEWSLDGEPWVVVQESKARKVNP